MSSVIYQTIWAARDKTKEYPHGWGFDAPLVSFRQDADPATVAKICRAKLSDLDFECVGVIPHKLISEIEIIPRDLTGIERITLERKEQIEKHNWSQEHDATHAHGELATVAAALCVFGTDVLIEDPSDFIEHGRDCWGLVEKHKENRIKQLQIAGALVASEIDRLLG